MYCVNEQETIDDILNRMQLIIEEQPHNRRQLVEFKKIIKKVHDIQNKDLLRSCYKNRGIHLICLTCRHNKKRLLRYLLHESHILHYFASENENMEAKYREDALYYAICSNEFKVIEMLYDHWSGDLHWLGYKNEYIFDVNNLNQINNTLKNALSRYENRMLSMVNKNINQTMIFNVQSLIALSEFQRDLYTKLNKLKEQLITLDGEAGDVVRLRETYGICNMILDMIALYEEHTNRVRHITQITVYETPDKFSDLSEFIESPKDTSELMCKTYLYIFFEVYFRKLDYNICLLILDNLHSLKLRLIMPEGSYQKLESKVYHFIYHLKSKWSLYIPKKRRMKTKTYSGQHNNIDCTFSIKYSADSFERGLHVIYLEKRDFENALYTFRNDLRHRNIKENIRKDNTELPNDEVNCLKFAPELRDIYSLQRISKHIAQLYSIDHKSKKYVCLLVERILQVVGEFLKSTNETLHLQPTTEALAEVEISVEVVHDLKILRDFLCHAKDGELLKRIEIETNNNDIFQTIFMELKLIKKKIDEVIIVCKPLVKKALILNSLSLIEKRKYEIPYIVANNWFNAIKHVRLLPQNEPYIELFWAPKGYAEEYATEVTMLVEHSLQLESKLLLVTENIRNNLTRKFSMYKDVINDSLQKIIEVKKNWQHIVKSLKDAIPSIVLSDDPNESDTNRIKTYSKQVNLRNDLNSLIEDNKLFAYAEIHWKFIKKILEFIILKTETMNRHCSPTELDKFTRELKILSYNNNDMKKTISDYLAIIEEKLGTYPNMKYENQLEFIGIKELRRKITLTNFLVQKEKQYLIDTLQNVSNIKRKDKIDKVIDKINNDYAITKTEYTNFIGTINIDKKAQKNLMNLVMGFKRDPLHPWCLSKRITLVREIAQDQSLDQLVTQYKLDKTFRVLLEVLVFDIFAILDCTKNNEIVKKSNKLLAEINLRNFLTHGSPLLEIVGNVLDSNDVPTELITKSLALLKEEKSINALCALKDLDFDFNEINSNSLSDDQRSLVAEFKTSTRWKDYLIFIPELKHNKNKNKKEIPEVDKKLLEAVLQNDSEAVLESIAAGGDLNYIHDSKRALIHHAAIKGSLDAMRELIINGADVNVRSKHNMTALHFSAMNGFVATVECLLKNGADCLARDDSGRTPLDVAHQRKHENVCLMLEQAMKKVVQQGKNG